jgi:hypothetical protein
MNTNGLEDGHSRGKYENMAKRRAHVKVEGRKKVNHLIQDKPFFEKKEFLKKFEAKKVKRRCNKC